MIVEVHGIGFWTRVRLPPGPFYRESREIVDSLFYWLYRIYYFIKNIIFYNLCCILHLYATRYATRKMIQYSPLRERSPSGFLLNRCGLFTVNYRYEPCIPWRFRTPLVTRHVLTIVVLVNLLDDF